MICRLKGIETVLLSMCSHGFGHAAFKLKIENLLVKSKKVKTALPIFKPTVGDLCAMLLGFYMTAAIACSSCAEFVRTALPTNRIVWYQVVVVSM